jgi:hypothetical protein
MSITGMHTVKSLTNAQFGLDKSADLYSLKSDCFLANKSLTSVVPVSLFTARISVILEGG